MGFEKTLMLEKMHLHSVETLTLLYISSTACAHLERFDLRSV